VIPSPRHHDRFASLAAPFGAGSHALPAEALGSASTALEANPAPDTAQPPAAPAKSPAKRPKPRRLPPYAVVLHNDNVNGFDYVVGVLRKVFRYGTARAFWLTLRTHVAGRCVVWTGSLEVAEFKADQICSLGPDPRKRSFGARPLRTSVERAG
jgi:ATP-dependent Clp protease adaptor protein ClpS